MPANKNAVTGYYIIDKLLDNSHSGMENGYGYVSILSEGTQKHLHLGRGRDVVLSFDGEAIDGKYVIICDDICSYGKTMMAFYRKLLDNGAKIV